jgi:hypothetical protein
VAINFERPNSALARELEEVSEASVRLTEYLRGDNTIPINFPKQKLIDISTSLGSTKDGTSAAAFHILAYASKRLLAMRREYLLHELVIPLSSDLSPPPQRGMALDRNLKDLIVSVGTALDECRKQTGILFEDDETQDILVADLSAQPGAQDLAKQSDRIRTGAQKLGDELNRSMASESKQADALARSLIDLYGLNKLIGVELRIPNAVLSWLKGLGRLILDYPELLKKLGSSLEVGSDIADPAWNRWHNAWHKIGTVVINEVRGFGRDLKDLVEKWEAKADAAANNQKSHSGHSPTSLEKEEGLSPSVGITTDYDTRRRILIEMSQRNNASVKLRQGAMIDLVSDFGNHKETFKLLVERLINDPNQSVRRYCLSAIGDARPQETSYVEFLDTMMEVYHHERIPSIGIIILKKIATSISTNGDNTQLYSFLIKLLDGNFPDDHKTTVIKILRKDFSIRAETLDRILQTAKNDASIDVRCRALSSLSDSFGSDERAEKVVFEIIQRDPNRGVKYAALKALERNFYSWTDSKKFLTSIAERTKDKTLANEMNRILSAMARR